MWEINVCGCRRTVCTANWDADVPAAAVAEREALGKEMLREALGPRAANEADTRTYGLIAGLSVHDLSAMRELIGMPEQVLCATRTPDGMFLQVMFQ